VARVLAPENGEVVVDLCAAPGGKTTQIAELMGDKGIVVAVDINPVRLAYVAVNSKRLGLHSVKPVAGDGRNLSVRGADRVLVDVPCSGTGVLAKRPDLRWNRRMEDIGRLAKLQLELLKNGSGMLRPGGVLVYSTCSLETEENQGVVEEFLSESPGFELERIDNNLPNALVSDGRYLFVTPQEHGVDGAFAARMARTG
jgi:16S rRNA (cytosine967-C5)-methyltransferase